MVTSSASAKMILFGEHAVVYGQPAIAFPVRSLRASVNIDIPEPPLDGIRIASGNMRKTLYIDAGQPVSPDPLVLVVQSVLKLAPDESSMGIDGADIIIESSIPIASGLGSGAAVSTALARSVALALNLTLDNSVINDIVYDAEKIHHGSPSGIDNTVVVYEKPVYFVRGQPIETLQFRRSLTMLVADTGQPSLTRDAIAQVRKMSDEEPTYVQRIMEDIGEIVINARLALENDNVEPIGPLMSANHVLLQKLGVSSPELDHLVDTAMNAGALGAKLSGGGMGGIVIALVSNNTADTICSTLLCEGAKQVFTTTID